MCVGQNRHSDVSMFVSLHTANEPILLDKWFLVCLVMASNFSFSPAYFSKSPHDWWWRHYIGGASSVNPTQLVATVFITVLSPHYTTPLPYPSITQESDSTHVTGCDDNTRWRPTRPSCHLSFNCKYTLASQPSVRSDMINSSELFI